MFCIDSTEHASNQQNEIAFKARSNIGCQATFYIQPLAIKDNWFRRNSYFTLSLVNCHPRFLLSRSAVDGATVKMIFKLLSPLFVCQFSIQDLNFKRKRNINAYSVLTHITSLSSTLVEIASINLLVWFMLLHKAKSIELLRDVCCINTRLLSLNYCVIKRPHTHTIDCD